MAKGAIKEFPFELSLIKMYSPVVNAGVSFMTPLQKISIRNEETHKHN